MRRLRCRSRWGSSSPTRRASAVTVRPFCISRACPSRRSSSSRIRRRAARRSMRRVCCATDVCRATVRCRSTSPASSPVSISSTRSTAASSVSWADLVAPAIKYAEEGFVLDATLPSSVAEGRQSFQKYTASSRIFLPNGRVPRPGERFVNRDYGDDAADDRQRRRAGVLSRLDRETHCRRHAGQRRADHRSRPGAVSSDRAQAGVGPLSRSRPVHRRTAGERRRVASSRRCRFSATTGRARGRRSRATPTTGTT